MAVAIRPTLESDLGWVTALERRPDHVDIIGQWSDAEHLAAIRRQHHREHWSIEREGAPAGYLIAYDCGEARAGLYVKRILVGEKERGTGKAALSAFLDDAFSRSGVDSVWLIVHHGNDRARAVYESLGFEPMEPDAEEAGRYDAVAEAPQDKCFRMRLALSRRR